MHGFLAALISCWFLEKKSLVGNFLYEHVFARPLARVEEWYVQENGGISFFSRYQCLAFFGASDRYQKLFGAMLLRSRSRVSTSLDLSKVFCLVLKLDGQFVFHVASA